MVKVCFVGFNLEAVQSLKLINMSLPTKLYPAYIASYRVRCMPFNMCSQ